MANEKPPRVTATKRAATATARAPRAAKTASPEAIPAPIAVNNAASVSEDQLSTPQPAVAAAHNIIRNPIEGKAAIDPDAVRRRAYEMYEQRGRLDGFHEQDWYSAEQELGRRKQSRSLNDGRTGDSQRSA